MSRTRTTKKLAQRVDLNYFKRATPFKRARFWLSLLLPVLAIAWIAWWSFHRDSRVYSSGRMSSAHAVLERQCAACHLQKAGQFSSAAVDSACVACHDGPIHHENQITSAVPNCATCHLEHRGRIMLTAASNQDCTQCHASLRVTTGQVHYTARIQNFNDDHPEFAVLRDGAKNPGTIRLNHAIHMKLIRQGPNGPLVQMQCSDCHRNYDADWKYAASQHPEPASYQAHPQNSETVYRQSPPALQTYAPASGRERMRPVQFATACSGCHLLTFDKRLDEGVPHDTPEVVHAFLIKKFQAYIQAHPTEVKVVRDPSRDLTGKPIPPEVRVLTPAQWVAERTADAELLLWRKTCRQCHALSGFVAMSEQVAAGWAGPRPESAIYVATLMQLNSTGQHNGAVPLPKISPANATARWLPHGNFSHDAHRGFSCTGCHSKALASTETSDVLVPGIANCKTCHAPGSDYAESRCFECHTYHDWAKRKEVRASYTLPALQRAR